MDAVAGHVRAAAADPVGAAPRPGVVEHGAAPARPSSTRVTCRRSWPVRRLAAAVCVYPFVRSYEVVPVAGRRPPRHVGRTRQDGLGTPMAGQHGGLASGSGLRVDLAFEADELHRIVDLMRDLRASGARQHVARRSPSSPAAAAPSPKSSKLCRNFCLAPLGWSLRAAAPHHVGFPPLRSLALAAVSPGAATRPSSRVRDSTTFRGWADLDGSIGDECPGRSGRRWWAGPRSVRRGCRRR